MKTKSKIFPYEEKAAKTEIRKTFFHIRCNQSYWGVQWKYQISTWNILSRTRGQRRYFLLKNWYSQNSHESNIFTKQNNIVRYFESAWFTTCKKMLQPWFLIILIIAFCPSCKFLFLATKHLLLEQRAVGINNLNLNQFRVIFHTRTLYGFFHPSHKEVVMSCWRCTPRDFCDFP